MSRLEQPLNHHILLLQWAAAGNPQANPPSGPLQIIILTCHPDRFDHLQGARHIDLTKCVGAEQGGRIGT